MKHMLLILLLVGVFMSSADAQWRCLYATYDDDSCPTCNATGNQVISVGVIKPDMFVALVTRIRSTYTCNFLLPYVNADSAHGRRYTYGYGSATSSVYQVWSDGAFDQIQMFNALSIVATPDSFIYVANNNNPAIANDPEHNILVFKYVDDTVKVVAPYWRTSTSLNGVWGLALDATKRVYISHDTTTNQAEDIKIYAPASTWGSSHVETPLRTIDLPNGIYKGMTVTSDGRNIFICDFTNRKVLKYTGTAATGYTLNTGFNFQLGQRDTIPATGGLGLAKPIGLAYLPSKNILAVACDSLLGGSPSYAYGRIYLVNPNTGAFISNDTSVYMIDQAAWNFALTGAYNNRPGGTVPGNASGYTSTYDVKFDTNENLYSVSFYGWTVEKWQYNGTLPTITSVEEVGGTVPETYVLKQNYPNPFNPATTIEFSVLKAGHISLKVYDVLGKEVATLVDEEREPGNFKVMFDASTLTSGTYLYTLRSGGFAETKKMLIVR